MAVNEGIATPAKMGRSTGCPLKHSAKRPAVGGVELRGCEPVPVIGRCSKSLNDNSWGPHSDYRRIRRWEIEEVLEQVQRQLNRIPVARTLRRSTVEHLFGMIKA